MNQVIKQAGKLFFSAFHYLPESEIKNYIRTEIVQKAGKLPKTAFISPGDNVLQVGTPFVKRVESLEKHAAESIILEPESQNFARLNEAAEEIKNVEVINKGAWSSKGQKELTVAKSEHPGDHKIPVENIEHDNDYRDNNYVDTQKIEVDTIDNVLNQMSFSPDYIEVMVNGAELEVLKGATDTLESGNSRWWIKGHARKDTGEPLNKKVVSLVEGHGYNTVISSGENSTVGEIPDWDKREGDVFAWKK